MKRKIRILLIAFCIKQALKFKQCEKMLLERVDSGDLIYSIGVSIVQHNKWIDRVKILQRWV